LDFISNHSAARELRIRGDGLGREDADRGSGG
jgi:hypothetical protein